MPMSPPDSTFAEGKPHVSGLARFLSFHGRLSRTEYWFLGLTLAMIGATVAIVGLINEQQWTLFMALALLWPNLALNSQRLHDTGRSGWYQCISLIPVAGGFMLLAALLARGDAQPNRFGPPQPLRLSTPFLVVAYLLWLIAANALVLVALKLADVGDSVAAYALFFLPLSYLLTIFYRRRFAPAPLRIVLPIKALLAGVSLILAAWMIVLGFDGQTVFDSLVMGLALLLPLCLLWLGALGLTLLEIRHPGGRREAAAVLAVIITTAVATLLVQGFHQYDFDTQVAIAPDAMNGLDRLRDIEALALLPHSDLTDADDLLSSALEHGNAAYAAVLLEHGADPQVDCYDTPFDNCFEGFVADGRLALAELLLDHGAQINAADKDGEGLIEALLEAHRLDVPTLRWLSAHGAQVRERTARFVLAYAEPAIAQAMLDHFPDFMERFRASVVPLAYWCRRTDCAAADVLDRSAPVTAAAIARVREAVRDEHRLKYYDRAQMLSDAIADDDRQTIAELLARDDLELQGDQPGRWTPLMAAAYYGKAQIARMLLEHGAEVDYVGAHARKALEVAILNRQPEVVQVLVDHGAQVNAPGFTMGYPLNLAQNRAPMLRILLAAGADPDTRSTDRGETVLHQAVFSYHPDVVQVMIDGGANLNLRNRWHDTALITAVDRGYEDLVALLATHGANLDATREYDHATALVLALSKGRDDIGRILIEAGANVRLADDAGQTPLDLATDPALRSRIERALRTQ